MKISQAGIVFLLISGFFTFLLMPGRAVSRDYTVTSPDKNIVCSIDVGKSSFNNGIFSYSIHYKSRNVILPSAFNLSIDSVALTTDFVVEKSETETVNQNWENRFGERSLIPDQYEQLKLHLRNGNQKLIVVCRAYNEGVAFSYEIPADEVNEANNKKGKRHKGGTLKPDKGRLHSSGIKDSENIRGGIASKRGKEIITLTDEHFTFRFAEDYSCWSAMRAQAAYEHIPISQLKDGSERPLVVECGPGVTVALAEARLVDYARMKFGPDLTNGFGIRTLLHGPVTSSLPLQSPWRVVMIAESPGQLLEHNYIIQNLNPPSAIADISWIKPGKALRDGTLTTQGAKACVDFVSQHGMQYVEFDAGWYGPENDETSDATAVSLDPKRSKGPLDLQEIISYAKSKGVGILLYVNHKALERQLDTLLPLYRDWGVAGIKFGFVNVGDRKWTAWLHDAVKKCAEYGMVVDIHDEYRPTGFSRTYPNLLTQEGIRGDEESIPNSHTLITAFTRMLAGAADNTVCYYAERVTTKMGSHASQLAKTVCLFSPLQFLYWYDRPPTAPEKQDGLWGSTNRIGNEPELEFFDKVPTVWDETKVLHGKIGENMVIARRTGQRWFIGGINGDQATNVTVKFDFLKPGVTYQAKIFSDDPSIQTYTHVRTDEMSVTSRSSYEIRLAPNTGVAMYLEINN